MRIQHNIMAMNAYRNYTNNVSAMKKNLEKLSSGYKINRAGDDAAGLAISEKMRAQITGLQQAQNNAKSGINLVQTAEGALTEVHDMLNRMVKLADQSANGTYDNTTDRTQMQKEINQLLDEINRIADSANFNGINLLDGTLGLNTDAFTVGGAVDAVAAETNDIAASKVASYATKNAGSTAAHYTGSAKTENPSFRISMGSLSFDIASASTNTQQVKVVVGGATITATFTGKVGGQATDTVTYTASQIATKLAEVFNKGVGTATGSYYGGEIGGLTFKASANGADITFSYVGIATAGKKGISSAAFTTTQATTFNDIYGGAVTTTLVTGGKGTNVTGFADHDILDPKEAVAGSDPKRAGIDVTLKADVFAKDGNILTIGTTDFTVRRTGTVASDATNVIDLTGLASDAATATIMRAAVLQLANMSAGDFDIQTVDPDNGKIHLEQTAESYNKGKGTTYTYADLTKLVSAKEVTKEAANAGTVLDIKSANVKGGNVLTIGEGTGAVKVKFADDDTTDAKVLAKLQAAVGTKYTVEMIAATATGSAVKGLASGATRFVIHGAAGAEAGPQILGKGLTLQIGDTSDDFNQLNVAVRDMHTDSLGIGDLKINTEESAQAAVDKIKAAINVVSDVRGTLGATQNRLDHTINNLSVMTENIQDAESTIRDTDVAEEMMAYTKNNILIQSAQAMLAQANQVPQGVLQLLQ